jgi:hypothetical protein
MEWHVNITEHRHMMDTWLIIIWLTNNSGVRGGAVG